MANKLSDPQRKLLARAVEGCLNSTGRNFTTDEVNKRTLDSLVALRGLTYTSTRPTKGAKVEYTIRVLGTAAHLV